MIKPQYIQSLLWLAASTFFAASAKADTNTPTFSRCNSATHGTAFYGAQCTQISVKSLSGVEQETINVLRAQARSTPKNDPLVVITGGPGTSAVSLAWQYLRFFSDVQKERDILFIDQRGTGKSATFTCEGAGDLDQHLPAEQLVQQMHDALIQCANNHPASQLKHINTPQAASDIEAVRKALGYSSLNLWGSSYGTRVAMEYQKRFAANTRTVILDGVAPAAIALPRHAEHDASIALMQLFKACAQQPSCQHTFGDVTQQWQQLLKQLAQQPVQATLKHPRTTKAVTITITPALLANWARFALYSQELAALLPLAIQYASDGDFTYLANLAQAASDSVQNSMSYGMHAAILCAEDTHAPKLKRDKPIALPAMPFAALNNLNPVCSAMPRSHPKPNFFTPVTSDAPTLVLSGQFDPVTPAFWGQWASQNMSNSLNLVLDGGHHGVSGLGCMPELIARFIDKGEHKTLDTSCTQNITPVHFFINAAGPALSSQTQEATQ